MRAVLDAVDVTAKQRGGKRLGVDPLARALRPCEEIRVPGPVDHALEQLSRARLGGEIGECAHAPTSASTRSATSAGLPDALTLTTRSGYRSAASRKPRATAWWKASGSLSMRSGLPPRRDGRLGRVELEQDRAVGQEPARCGHVDRHHLVHPEAPRASLVGQRRVDVAVGDDHGAALERRADHGLHELSAGGGVEQRLCPRADLGLGVEQERADPLSRRGASGLAHAHDLSAALTQRLFEQLHLRRLSRAVQALERDKHG